MLGNVSKPPASERGRIELDAKKCRFRVLIGRESRRESWAGGSDEGPRRRATFSFNEVEPGPRARPLRSVATGAAGNVSFGTSDSDSRSAAQGSRPAFDKRLLALIADVCDATGNESLRLRGLLSDQKRAGERV